MTAVLEATTWGMPLVETRVLGEVEEDPPLDQAEPGPSMGHASEVQAPHPTPGAFWALASVVGRSAEHRPGYAQG